MARRCGSDVRWLQCLLARLRRVLAGALLLDAGAALLFFGVLAQQPELAAQGQAALAELAALGYRLPGREDPLRIYPVQKQTEVASGCGAAWRPGVIALRPRPAGDLPAAVYLRHDLLHEASFRTCGGSLPLWAEEAAAMRFSGELRRVPEQHDPPTAAERVHLREQVRLGARLDGRSYRTLAALVADHGWPPEPCARSEAIEALLAQQPMANAGASSFLLASLLSGRILESGGDLKTRHPPGSLLKIPYAAALTEPPSEALAQELATSDTQRLLARRDACDWLRYKLLLSPASLNRIVAQSGPPAREDEGAWRTLLGEREADGAFMLEANLPELLRILRAALLSRPEAFEGLWQNGTLPGSTLFEQPESLRRVLSQAHALAKTGTVSDVRGQPLVGHLMVAWPAREPAYLALFRTIGASGAANLRLAAPRLNEWAERYPATPAARVRIRLLSLVPRSSWEVLERGAGFSRTGSDGGRQQVSLDGTFRIVSTARGSRSERCLAGMLEHSADTQQTVLVTDAESYADGVLAAEAQNLPPAARAALRAVIVWNALRAGNRHPESASLCDTTHCMVFMGLPCDTPAPRGPVTDPALLQLLGEAVRGRQLPAWLPFAQGGVERWHVELTGAELARRVDEPRVLDLRRERMRTGEVVIHLSYPQGEEQVACELLRSRLKLPACPETIRQRPDGSGWVFEGIGQGHGQGLSLERARQLARLGWDAAALLRDAFGAPTTGQETKQDTQRTGS